MRRDQRKVTEKQEQVAIVKLLQSIGAKVYPLSQPRATMQAEGLPDLWVFLPSRILADGWIESSSGLWVEVKRAGGKMRVEQAAFALSCEHANVHHIVGGLDDMIAWLRLGGWLK